MEITVLENCLVSPPASSVAGKSLPLTSFDIEWINLKVKSLFFYDFPESESNSSHFIQIIVPALKHSLSLSLKHFYPLAGKLMVPASTNKPEIRYSDVDSVVLTVAECRSTSHDYFNHLTGNHARNKDDFFHLLPRFTPSSSSDPPDCLVPQLLALQVTLFPGHGISVGLACEHSFGDAKTCFTFLRAWSSIAKLGGDDNPRTSSFLPFYDRSVLKERKEVDSHRVLLKKKEQEEENKRPPPAQAGTKKVRATFIMDRVNIQGLKNLVSSKLPTLAHVTSFTALCAYIWVLMAKARKAIGEEMHGDELEHFVIAVDCRARLDPPVPETYFGNCIVRCFARVRTMELVGGGDQEGFLIAAKSLGEAISARLHNSKEEGGVFKGEEKWDAELKAIIGHKRVYTITGSPNIAFYDVDFGWGRPKKAEFVTSHFFLTRCKDVEGAVEIGLCLSENEMDAFSNIFSKGILNYAGGAALLGTV